MHMKERIYDSTILKVLGSFEVDPQEVGKLEERCEDEGEVELTLTVGVDAIEDKHTHAEGKFDKIVKVRAIKIVSITKI